MSGIMENHPPDNKRGARKYFTSNRVANFHGMFISGPKSSSGGLEMALIFSSGGLGLEMSESMENHSPDNRI